MTRADSGVTENKDPDTTISNTTGGPSDDRNMGTSHGTCMSGAQLCNDILSRASLLSIPTISAKSTREAKRDERAKRIIRRHDREDGLPMTALDPTSNVSCSTRDGDQSGVSKGKEKEIQGEREQDEGHAAGGMELGDEILAYQGISSQIRARRQIEADFDEDQDGEGYQPRSSQIKRREGFGLVDPNHHGETQSSTQAALVWESTLHPASLGTSRFPPLPSICDAHILT